MSEPMPTLRARWTRFLVKHYLGRKYRNAGDSTEELRKLDDLLIRSQRLPKGTQVSRVSVNGLPAEWIQGYGAGSGAGSEAGSEAGSVAALHALKKRSRNSRYFFEYSWWRPRGNKFWITP